MRTNIPKNGVTTVEATALSLLFARYIAGRISDASWMQMMSILDGRITSSSERSALVYFLNDACADLGPGAVKVPGIGDLEDLVTVMRAA